jgi:protein-tyrosine kinase
VVERLKDAIIKARERREVGASPPVTPPPPVGGSSQPADELRDAMLAAVSRGPGAATGAARRMPVDEEWASLPQLTLNPARLDQHRIVSYRKSHPAHVGFDMLRTRLLNVLRTNGWNRLAITSPTKNCGKTMVGLNLALSLGHQNDLRSMFFDMDMRSPSAAKYLDVREQIAMSNYLQGTIGDDQFLRRAGPNLAFGLNTESVSAPAELLHHERTKAVLSSTLTRYRPNVVIYDLPPVLVSDDVMAFLSHVDCVLMVA